MQRDFLLTTHGFPLAPIRALHRMRRSFERSARLGIFEFARTSLQAEGLCGLSDTHRPESVRLHR